MSRIATFDTPESIDNAISRIVILKQDIAAIGLQLQQPKTEREEPGWRRRAFAAITFKRQEKDYLKEWIRQNKKTKTKPPVQTISDLSEHFRTHSKLIGKLGNLLEAAKNHVANDTEESFELLAAEIEKIEELIEAP